MEFLVDLVFHIKNVVVYLDPVEVLFLKHQTTYRMEVMEVRPIGVLYMTDEKVQIKVIFADNSLQAEELLMEKRDQPIMREWEK